MTIDEVLRALEHATTQDSGLRNSVRAFAFEHFVKMPVLFTDQLGIHYLLYPGQNAQVYFDNSGNYEVAETRFCLRYLKPGMTAFDVGANIGFYAMLFSKQVGPTGTVHSFEPELRNYERLKLNATINGVSNVTLNNLAVFSRSQQLDLNLFPDSVNAWHTLGKPTLPDPWNPGRTMTPTETQRVQGISLDEYCASRGISRIHLLKVDVEGAELDVFQGATKLFAQNAVDAVMFEVSKPQVEAMGHGTAETFAFIQSCGFQVHAINEDGSPGALVSSPSERYQNFVALRPGVGGF